MKKYLRKSILNPFLIFGLLTILLIFASYKLAINRFHDFKDLQPKQTHHVVLTEDGFSPQEITINKGDTVEFSSDGGNLFWPASNLHPTHSIYPEFDPKKPIDADKGWSFTFEKAGSWKFHDHLSPLYKGEVLVLEGKETIGSACQNNKENKQCYEELIDTTLKTKGLKDAFNVLAAFFEKDSNFASDCHDFTHKLGEKAYYLFSEKKAFSLSEKSSYCGYGFYHGFMETLLQKTADMDEARKFCEYADLELKKTTSDAGGACFHGIGHGAVDGSDPRSWGNPQAMIKPALSICELVSNDENPPPRYGKLYRCVSGVFNGLEILSTSNQYKLSISKEDPFWLCKLQPENYKEACFTQFVVAVMNITSNNFEKSSQIIDTIKEDTYAIPALQALTVELVKMGKTNYQKTLDFCHNLSDRFQMPCITAFAEGFLKYGPPEKEYVEAIKFCNWDLLEEFEKNACFERVLSLLRIWYSASKSQSICEQVNEKYRWQNCQYN